MQYTLLVRLHTNEIRVETATADTVERAEHNVRSYARMAEEWPIEILSIHAGSPETFVVCLEGPDGCYRDVVRAANEAQAILHAKVVNRNVTRAYWAQKAVPDHVHIGYVSSDCDGRYTGGSVALLPQYKERTSVHRGEGHTPRERLGLFVADAISGNLMFGCEFSVQMHGDYITVDEPSDEGGRSTCYAVCDDLLCDEVDMKSWRRDHTAERAGY